MFSASDRTRLPAHRFGKTAPRISLKFIVSSGEPLSTRERELQDQAAKSHAAKISNKRKRKAGANTQALDTVPNSTNSWIAPIHAGFGGFRHEVYVAFSEEYTADLRPTLDYWIDAMTPRYDLFTEIFDCHHPFQFFIRDIGKHEFVLAGLSVYALVIHYDQAKEPQSPPQKVLSQRHQAIERIREQFRRGIWGDATPVAIAYLAILASMLQEKAGAQKHFSGLQAIVAQMGGLDGLKPHVRSHIMLLETGWSLRTGKSPFKRKRSWNPIYPPIESFADLEDIPPGFRDLVRQRRLSVDTIRVIQRLSRATLAPTSYSKLNRRRNVRYGERTYDDCIESCPVFFAPDSQGIMLEKMVCFALILYCSVESGFRGRAAWWRASRIYLRRTMRLFRPTTEAEYKCLAWVYVVTIDSCRYGYAATYLNEEGQALLAEFVENFTSFCCSEWEEFETVLQDFFWPSECSSYWKLSWANLPSSPMSGTLSDLALEVAVTIRKFGSVAVAEGL